MGIDLFAYLDPGTGSFIVQALIGAAVGVGIAAKTQWHNIKAFFSKSTGKETKQTDEEK